MSRRILPFLLAAAAVLAAAAAAIALNLLVLGQASGRSDRIVRLSPKANLPPAPSWAVRPVHHDRERDGHDD
ncbi:MAG TPA: hypothetical protein VFL60_10790 [Gaiellaceae bacterium]|nr:hypothetical protein [Gaiellaceae bacterium]